MVSMDSLFAKTLILGASVSNAAVERNPTKLFLREHRWLEGSITYARAGTPGAKVLSGFKKSLLDSRTAVIAIDLFFWDSVIGLGDAREAKAFMRGFFKELRARSLPLIVGNIPNFHALQIHREELNEALQREVGLFREAGVRAELFPLDDLFRRATENEGLSIDGRHHALSI